MTPFGWIKAAVCLCGWPNRGECPRCVKAGRDLNLRHGEPDGKTASVAAQEPASDSRATVGPGNGIRHGAWRTAGGFKAHFVRTGHERSLCNIAPYRGWADAGLMAFEKCKTCEMLSQ